MLMNTGDKARLEEIASSADSVYDAVMNSTAECMADLAERVADTGATFMEREVEFAGQTWTVTVRLNSAQ